MFLRKRRYPRRSIRWNGAGRYVSGGFSVGKIADEGQITVCSGLFFLLFFAVLLVSYFQMEMIRSSSRYLEDALAASGLASALIDVREYGSTHVLRIEDPKAAYERYQSSLKMNLGLDDAWECHNKRLISGCVSVESYVIYNVTGELVEFCRLDGGREEWKTGRKGQVFAPNGQMIERTGIYSEISYPVTGVMGITVTARKGKLIDVVGDE